MSSIPDWDDRATKPVWLPVAGAIAAAGLLVGLVAVWANGGSAPSGRALLTPGLAFAALSLFVVKCMLRSRLPEASSSFSRLYGEVDRPSALSDRTGRILALNPAGRQLWSGNGSIEAAVSTWLSNPAPLIYQMIRGLHRTGQVTEELALDDGYVRLVAQSAGPDLVVWQVAEMATDESGEVAERTGDLPQILVSSTGAVLKMNRAARALAGNDIRHVTDLFEDLPFRHGGIHRLLPAAALPVRLHVTRTGDGGQNLVMIPCDPTELSGVAPEGVLDDLPVALARLKPDGTLVYANAAAKALLGGRAVPGAQIAGLIEGLGRSIPERLLDTARGRAQGRSEVARGKIEDREIFLQVTLTRVMMDGEVSLLAVLADATELKTLEAQFVQSQKMQAVGQLAGGIAHDFNNLLTAIHGHCDLLLLRHDQGDPDFADLTQIRQNANRAASLVSQLLAFSRKQTLRPTVLQLSDTLSEIAHLLNRLLGAKVSLEIESAPNLWCVRVDERQFEQVIVNLAVNARDAMPTGGSVKVVAENCLLETELQRDRATVPPGEYVRVSVSDTGSGIPPDKIGKIFEPFFTTKRIGEGTGLGLSTVYGIVKQTGGFIFADSEVGQGASFTVYLPAHEDEGDTADQPASEPREPRTTGGLAGRGVILLVEDEAPVRSVAARALQMRGYTVLEADSGEAALKILDDSPPHVDLFLSDVIMPGIDGPTWVEEAKKRGIEAPTIFVSGYAEDAFRDGRGELDQAVFLPKPFSINELAEKVKFTLGQAG